jgi:hypothetical protein
MKYDVEAIKRQIAEMDPDAETIYCGRLWSKQAGVPRNIWILLNSDTDIALYLNGPPFHALNSCGTFGKQWRIRRVKRGFLWSTFAFATEGSVEVQYMTDNKFGDMLSSCVDRPGAK